jgi:hypothetical protein
VSICEKCLRRLSELSFGIVGALRYEEWNQIMTEKKQSIIPILEDIILQIKHGSIEGVEINIDNSVLLKKITIHVEFKQDNPLTQTWQVIPIPPDSENAERDYDRTDQNR